MRVGYGLLILIAMCSIEVLGANATIEAGDNWPTVAAGDTVFLSDANGNYTSGYSFDAHGSRGNEIVVMAVPGESPQFTTGLAGDAAFTSAGFDHYKIRGIRFVTCWRAFSATTSSVDNITFEDNFFYNFGDSPIISYGAGGQLLKVLNNYFDHADTSGKSPYPDAGNADGVTGWNNVDSVLIQGNTFVRCSHQAINLYTNCDVIIIKDNIGIKNHGHFGGNGGASQILFEGNFISHPGALYGDGAVLQWIDYNLTSAAPIIWRFNSMVDETVNTNNTQEGLLLLVAEDEAVGGSVRNLRMCYNTVDGTNDASYDKPILLLKVQDYADESATNDDNRVVNNICVNPSNNYYAFQIINNLESDNSYFDGEYRNNLLHKVNANETFWRVANNSSSATYTISSLEAAFANCSGNKDTLGCFVDRANYDFTPVEDTWARGNATYLTLASGSGSSSTSLTVDDAKWFCDGWGLIDADSIDIAGTIREISAVNYGTNVITLAASASWDDNAEIFLVKNGEKANEVGAVQVVSEEEPEEPDPPPGRVLKIRKAQP